MAAEVKVGMVRADSIRVHPRNVRKDLGDLRELTDSIARFGVMQPVTVEHRGDHLRLRHGHRRVAAARLAGLTRIPAIVHTDQLGDADFLVQAVHENTRRSELDRADRAQTVRDLRKLGVPWEVIADEFTVSVSTARCWLDPAAARPSREQRAALVAGARDLRRQGLSLRQIADRLGIAQSRVNGLLYDKVPTSRLRELADAWDAVPGASAADILAALRAAAEFGSLTDALPVRRDQSA